MTKETISIKQVDRYTTICNIEGKEIRIVNQGLKHKDIETIGNKAFEILSIIGCVFFFLMLLGIIGRIEFYDGIHNLDTWSPVQYFIYIAISFVGLFISGTSLVKTAKH